MSPRTVSVFAPAKVNLTLHITGRRDDGYHLLDSLVVFAPVGDRLTIRDGDTLSLTVGGPEAAGVPAGMDNLALRAARVLAGGEGAALSLHKTLPVASGIGGGSSDAAAALRGMLAWREDLTARHRDDPGAALEPYARDILALGADVPMCLLARPCRARGIGEILDHVALPPVPAVLVNPRVPVSTADVFRSLATPDNPPMPDPLPDFPDPAALIDWLATQRNDLETPARALAPEIDAVLAALAATAGCRLARMTGSGATCFGLFADEAAARAAAAALQRTHHPGWWVAGGTLGDMTRRATPKTA